MANYTTRRLAITLALFIERFGEWPTEVRFSSTALYWAANGLAEQEFERLAARFKMRVAKHSYLAVGSSKGHQVYTQDTHPEMETVDAVERELGIVLPKPTG